MATSAAPPAKVFTTPSGKPDVRLQVFHQAFHLHSTVLKLKSEFFCKFLDSPDKVARRLEAPPGAFKYDWSTMVDGDGSWHLVGPDEGEEKYLQNFKGDVAAEIAAFEILLRAMYGLNFVVLSFEQLKLVTGMADYYRALPAFSIALKGSFFISPDLISETSSRPHEIIPIAAKIRNSLLYRECLIHTMAPWSKPRYLLIEDEDLRRLAAAAYAKLERMVWQTHSEILNEFLGFNVDAIMLFQSAQLFAARFSNTSLASGQSGVALPQMYWLLYEEPSARVSVIFKYAIQPLMKNNLVLDRRTFEPRDVSHKESFLCLEITDDELPWDIEHTDW
ncbi:hypothetical protein LSUE1_G010062 [Lachnellula suecica]|uniref:BTB domain-containing protein n=1 Tax=Lachnellula suecica TaxID=602035 RepID=A0A8T9BS23_9HELO|nr:hypothetical protein LSUE1_G010062 [Lachnellula suecica]